MQEEINALKETNWKLKMKVPDGLQLQAQHWPQLELA